MSKVVSVVLREKLFFSSNSAHRKFCYGRIDGMQLFYTCHFICMQNVSGHTLTMPDYDKSLRWTSFPAPCENSLGVRRKRRRTEKVSLKSICFPLAESFPKAACLEAEGECTVGSDCAVSPVLSRTSGTDSVPLAVGCCSGTTGSYTVVVTTSTVSAINSSPVISDVTQSQKFRCNNFGDEQPRIDLLRTPYKNSGLKVEAQLKDTITSYSSLKGTTAGNTNGDSDLHRCPLCDVAFDRR